MGTPYDQRIAAILGGSPETNPSEMVDLRKVQALYILLMMATEDAEAWLRDYGKEEMTMSQPATCSPQAEADAV